MITKLLPRFPRAVAVLLASASVLVSFSATAAHGVANQAAEPVKVASLNAMMLPASTYDNSGRASRIVAADWLRGQDIVVFQELFENKVSNDLLGAISGQYPYQTPVVGRTRAGWDETLGSWSWATPEDGGVAIVSRWPIAERVQVLFKNSCGADAFALKGFAYARVLVNGKNVHVVGVHAQSEDGACRSGQPARVRAKQFNQMKQFLDSRSIPKDEQVIIAGDFNVIGGTAEYQDLLTRLDLKAPTAFTGARYSFDVANNSIAGSRYPGTNNEQLDYIFYRQGHPGSAPIHTLDESIKPWKSWGHTLSDYSDHYPVFNY